MIGLDTNVLARFLLRDDETQYQAVTALLKEHRVYTAPPSVILELVWVLESEDCDRQAVIRALRYLLSLPNFKPLELDSILRAVAWFESGLDFGDALHLATSARAGLEEFITMDKVLARRAKREGASIPVTTC